MLGGTVLGGTGTVVITTGFGCSGGFRAGRALPEGGERKKAMSGLQAFGQGPVSGGPIT